MSKFWSKSNQKENNIRWHSWDNMGQQKIKGWMGFRDLKSFNNALLAKQGWRFIQNPQSLAATFFKEKYFKDKPFLESKIGNQSSLIWRSVWNSISLLKECLKLRVGNGRQIPIWGSKWFSSLSARSPITILNKTTKLVEFIYQSTGSLKHQLI